MPRESGASSKHRPASELKGPVLWRKRHPISLAWEPSIASKLSRNTAPAAFFVAALVAIGCEVVKLEDI
jgi:hypothetical protein